MIRKQVTFQTLFLLLIMSVFSAMCYKNMLEENTYDEKIEECKSIVQEAEDIFEAIDHTVKWMDNCWYDSIINKEMLRSVDANYSYIMTKEIFSNQVIKGKDDWLFYKSIGDGDTIADYEGTNLYSQEELEQLSVSVENLQQILEDRNIEFQLLICPNKEIVYHEYMPENYMRAEVTRGDMVYDSFIQKGINVVYPKALLKGNKYCQLFYRYDTHWNQLGAYVATRKVLEQWGINVDVLLECEISSKPLKENHHLSAIEDLADMAGVLPVLERKKPDLEYVVEGTVDIDWEIVASDEAEKKTSHFYNADARVKKTLFLVGDSFRVAMIPLLSEVFENVYVVSRGYYESGLLNQINPDYVIAEYVERYTDELVDIDELILQ